MTRKEIIESIEEIEKYIKGTCDNTITMNYRIDDVCNAKVDICYCGYSVSSDFLDQETDLGKFTAMWCATLTTLREVENLRKRGYIKNEN